MLDAATPRWCMLVAAAQPAGRRGRVPRPLVADDDRQSGRSTRARRAAFSRPRAAAADAHADRDDRMMLGYRCANSRHDDRRRRRPPHRDRATSPTSSPSRPTRTCAKIVYRVDATQGEPIRLAKYRRLPHARAACRARGARPTGCDAHRSTAPRDDGLDALRRRPARLARRLLGGERRRDRRRPERAARGRSRRSAGTCSSSPRRSAAPTGSGIAGQGRHRLAATRATTSGTPRSTCCRSSPTRSPRWPATLLRFRYAHARRRPRPRAASWRSAGRCSRGARSTARRRRRTTPPAPRSTTSTPTSPTR